MKMRLTDMAVKKLSYPEKGQIIYWDDTTPGFGLRCSTKSKSFVVMFGEKRRLKTLGRYPNLSLSDARRDARLFLSEASFGKHQETRISFEKAKELYLADCEARLRPLTVREYRRHLNFFAWSKDVADLERSDVFRRLDELKKTPTNQNYAFTTAKAFLNWCVRNQYMETNPIASEKKPARLHSRERILNEQELAILYSFVRSNRSTFNDIVAMLILTGQRKTEIAHLSWSEVNSDSIELPPERTKNNQRHKIPLLRSGHENHSITGKLQPVGI